MYQEKTGGRYGTEDQICTDSASDIPRSLREELDILCSPSPSPWGAREYQDGVDFTPAEFYDMLLASPHIPTHAQLTPFVFSQCFEEAFRQGYTDLIYTSHQFQGFCHPSERSSGPGGVL